MSRSVQEIILNFANTAFSLVFFFFLMSVGEGVSHSVCPTQPMELDLPKGESILNVEAFWPVLLPLDWIKG